MKTCAITSTCSSYCINECGTVDERLCSYSEFCGNSISMAKFGMHEDPSKLLYEQSSPPTTKFDVHTALVL